MFEETGRSPIGTAFIVRVPVQSAPESAVPLIVTAKHVIGDRDKVVGRFSAKGVQTTAIHEYDLRAMRHDGDVWEHQDDGVDLAVFRTQHFELADYEALSLDAIATKEHFDKGEISATHQVIFPSLLVAFYGETRNYPVIRAGTIAAIPDEPIPFEYPVGSRVIKSRQPVILIDATAIPGASGSPVYFWPTTRIQGFKFVQAGGPVHLIGVMHGFYMAPPREVEVLAAMPEFQAFRENSGIAIVVPSWRLLEILEQPAVRTRVEELWHDSKR